VFTKLVLAGLAVSASAVPALAHLNPAEHGSFATGLSHPMFGADHVLAMVAVGLWAALASGRALWQVPAAFVGTMLVGFVAALEGLPLPFVEPVILASVVVLGLLVAAAAPVPAGAGLALVGFFAFFLGHAHGGEIGGAGALSYAAGFAVATAILHLVGNGLGRLFGGKAGVIAARIAGGMASLAGIALAGVEIFA
jgi:urease accessory protein